MSILSEIAQEECEMEMTPMIDVVFLLLIFFLLTIKFKILEGKLAAYLPKDVGVNSSQAEPKEKVEITIHVKEKGGQIFATGTDKGSPWDGDSKRRFDFVDIGLFGTAKGFKSDKQVRYKTRNVTDIY